MLGEGPKGAPSNGKIGEVLVWNRVLSETEMEHVDHYLKVKTEFTRARFRIEDLFLVSLLPSFDCAL